MKTIEKKFRPKSSRTILSATVSFLFTVYGSLMIQDNSTEGWLVAIFFGLCLLVFTIQIIPGSTELRLDSEGFEMTSLFRKTMVRWNEVKIFKIGHLGGNEAVMFDYVEGDNQNNTVKTIAKELSGSHGALPLTYGLKATDLLEIMNEWKERYSG